MSDYMAKAHAMQSGVAMKMNYDDTDTSAKHLRVGVNTAMCDQAGLVRLLINEGRDHANGIPSRHLEMAREVERYERWLNDHVGGGGDRITLA
jgi:hypothetical protein